MNSLTHEQAAFTLAQDYLAGDDSTRRHIAITCEEQGILAALVVLALPEQMRVEFIRTMQATLLER
jgi:hypothetical protein